MPRTLVAGLPAHGEQSAGGVGEPVPAFEALLEHLKASRGFDFTGYKTLEPDAPGGPPDDTGVGR
jgi:hypothetical protein